MTDQTPTHIASKKARRRKRPFWVWVAVAILCILSLLLITFLWAWHNRTDLAEQLIIDTLAQDGIKIELDITELSDERAILQNIKMGYDKKTFFEAKNITATYFWREALEGKVKRITFNGAKVKVTIDEKGQIIDGWLPPGLGEESSNNNSFPPEGLSLKDSRLLLTTPLGEMDISGGIEAKNKDNFIADIILPQTHLGQNDTKIILEAHANITMQNGLIKSSGHMTLPSIIHPVMDGENIKLTYDGSPDLSSPQKFTGTLSADFDNITSAQLILGKGKLDWNGKITRAPIGLDLDGNWSVELDALALPDPVLVKDIAKKLSLSETLSNTPIAMEFAPSLESVLFDILTQSAVSASGNIQRHKSGVIVHLDDTARARTKDNILSITPKPDKPAYQFDRTAQRVESYFDLAASSLGGITAKDITFKAESFNGYRLDEVETFSAEIYTSLPWENENKSATLRPFQANIKYKGNIPSKRDLRLSGIIDYDGPVPGGIVTGLQTSGDLHVNLTDELTWMNFEPFKNDLIKIQSIKTPADWIAHNITARLKPATPLYSRKGKETEIFTNLSNIELQTKRTSTPANLDITANTANLKGILKQTGETLKQDWDIEFIDAKIRSDDLPGPNTQIDLGSGELHSELTTNQSLNFELKTPRAQIKTPLINAIDMSLDISGTPDSYTILHDKGRVKISGNDLPPLPIEGNIFAKNGIFDGSAKAFLPQANNTPITISYNIKDSRGTAIVDINELFFVPGGLQPQNLISALSGKIAQVEGQASAKIFLEFGANEPFNSYGKAKIAGMNFATAPGPLTDVSTELDLVSVLPLKTRGRQTLTVKSFDPGLPLENGIIEYELIEGGIEVYSARWPIGDGFFSLDPFTWLYAAEENRMTLRLEKINLGEFINNLGNGALKASGELEGELPVVISGINVRVEDGLIRVPNGGRIQYAAAEAEAVTTEVGKYAGGAMEALRDFTYQELFAKIDGPLDGEVLVGMKFQGKNEKVLNGQPFAFDVNIAGELFNILRSFDSNEHIKSTVAQQSRTETLE